MDPIYSSFGVKKRSAPGVEEIDENDPFCFVDTSSPSVTSDIQDEVSPYC